jgi:hypothetical protein
MEPEAYFDMLIDWKKLPAYKLEPRVDSLIGYYLPEILYDYLGEKIVGIIPELPLRKGTLYPELEANRHADLSTKVDFYALGSSGTHYMIEMKSDSGSRRDSQDDYLQKSCEHGMGDVVAGIVRIASVSSYKKKYNHLKSKLNDLELLDVQDQFIGSSDTVKVIYVQPRVLGGDESHDVIDFEYIGKWLKVNYGDNEFAVGLAGAL